MEQSLFQRFSKYEDELLKKHERHRLFTEIEKLSNDQFLNVLVQDGEGISANFVKFLETALRLIKNELAKNAIIRILRDEIPSNGPTHQQLRTQSFELIGVTPLQLVSAPISEITKQTMNNCFDVLCNPNRKWNNRDLGLTTFVRVMGESSIGILFKMFTLEIVRRFNVKKEDVTFYFYHWKHDEKGGTPFEGAEIGHTEYYDIAMQDLLKTEGDLTEAKKMADLAFEIQGKFQDQFFK